MKHLFHKQAWIVICLLFLFNCQRDRQPVTVITDDVVPIDTTTDPAYVYAYQQSKFVPPEGKVLLISGQEKHEIPAYLNKTNIIPGGLASYCAVCDMGAVTTDSKDQGWGVQNLKFLVDTYPNTVQQSAMWMGMNDNGFVCDETIAGKNDKYIDNYINYVKTIHVPIYLRIGYEFDGKHNKFEPTKYIKAYKHIVDRMRNAGVNNMAFVWHSYAAPPYNGYALMDWYPGDDYVDWFAISIFQVFYGGKPYDNSYMDAVIDQAKAHKKPVMIAESTPATGIVPDSYDTWNNWFVTTFNYIYQKNIKAFSYINCNWDSYEKTKNDKWGNTRVQEYPIVFEQWLKEISKPKYLKASGTLFKELGYK